MTATAEVIGSIGATPEQAELLTFFEWLRANYWGHLPAELELEDVVCLSHHLKSGQWSPDIVGMVWGMLLQWGPKDRDKPARILIATRHSTQENMTSLAGMWRRVLWHSRGRLKRWWFERVMGEDELADAKMWAEIMIARYQAEEASP